MDMSTPPSPILKATSPSIAPVENATTHHAVPSSIDINASELDVLKLTSTVPKSPEAPGVGSAVSGDSTIPGLSLAAGDVREPDRYDNHTGPNNASTAQKDEPSANLAFSRENKETTPGHLPSSPTVEVPAEETECDMDMSPPPSPSPPPAPRSPTFSLRSSVPADTTSVVLPPRAVVEPPTTTAATRIEAPKGSLPQASAGAGTSTAVSSVARLAPVLIPPAGAAHEAPVEEGAPSPPAVRNDASPEEQNSREGSPMMVESLLGLTEPPPITESSVVPDDTAMVEGSPTVVDSMPISPIVQNASHPEQQQDGPEEVPLRKPVDLGSECPVQVCRVLS